MFAEFLNRDEFYDKYMSILATRMAIGNMEMESPPGTISEKYIDILNNMEAFTNLINSDIDRLTPDDIKKCLKKIKLHRKFMSLYHLRFCGYNREELYKRIMYRILCLLPLSFYRSLLKRISSINKKTNTLVCYSYRMLINKDLYFNFNDIFPPKLVNFEDRQYYIMNRPDAYLKMMYNDYMSLPPIEKRECHLNGEILFNV